MVRQPTRNKQVPSWFLMAANIATAVALKATEKLMEKALSSKAKPKKKREAKPNEEVKEIKREVAQVAAKPRRVRELQGVSMPQTIHVREAHKIRTPKMTVRTSKYKGNDALRLTGSDLWGTVTTASGGQYDQMFILPLTPTAIVNTRVMIEAQLWTKFRYHSMQVEFIPVLSTSTNGAMMLAYLADPELPIPGSEGSLQYATALMGCKGSVISPYYIENKLTFRPPPGDKEYYIQPDENNESRLTAEGRVVCLQMTNDNPGVVGFLYVHYDLTFYGKVISVNANSWSSINVKLAGGSANGTIVLNDGGALGVLSLTPDTTENHMGSNTVYLCYFNFDRGALQAMSLFYIKTPTTFNSANSTRLYTNATDAFNFTSENSYRGSVFSSSPIPSNATIYYMQATADPFDPDLVEDTERTSTPSMSTRPGFSKGVHSPGSMARNDVTTKVRKPP
jgi:hypothetical protein